MCLVVFAWKSHPEYQLILAANRDELHRRPSQALHRWPDNPDVLAGRDLQAGGTWLATNRNSRFATVTNYREHAKSAGGLPSRGALVTAFVTGTSSAGSFAESIDGNAYAGFSLLTSDGDDLYYVSNRGDPATRLAPGIYGLSNASLDTPWPKVLRSRDALNDLIDADTINTTSLFRLMADRSCASIADVETDHLPFKLARALTAPFIVSPDYGTRCSTALLWSNKGYVELSERRFDANGIANGESSYRFLAEKN
jgi:uncharacterized protein with NRDE domain